MYVEGLIDKDYLDMLITWGHEPDWICYTSEEAIKKGYQLELGNDNDVLTRIWVDTNIENFFPPDDMIKDDPDLLGIMAVSKNEKLRKFAERILKNGMAEKR